MYFGDLLFLGVSLSSGSGRRRAGKHSDAVATLPRALATVMAQKDLQLVDAPVDRSASRDR
jgi:hypothetical protein